VNGDNSTEHANTIPKRSSLQEDIEKVLEHPKKVTETATYSEKKIGFATHVGMHRQLNEDSLASLEVTAAYESKTKKRLLLLVADGMGGHNAGEIASRMGSETVVNALAQLLSSKDEDASRYVEAFRTAISLANQRILEASIQTSGSEGMGTTLTLAIIDGNQLHTANVGDSRCYIINEEDVWQFTKDHSYVQQLVDRGQITREEARTHPRRNEITRVVGYYGVVEIDTGVTSLDGNDRVLLCSDGLTAHVEDDELKRMVLDHTDPQKACDELVGLANSRGGRDNISVIIAPANIVI
jgi:serine/threonine protein phosphatase PrpC